MFLDRIIGVRIREKEFKAMTKILSKNRDKYNSIGHFVRAAISKKIREER